MQSDETLPTFRQKKNKLDPRIMWGLFTLIQLLLVGVTFVAGVLTDQWYLSNKQEFPLLQHAMDVLSGHAYSDLPSS